MTALDNARDAAAKREASLEAADAETLGALTDPTAALAAQFGEASLKVRSRMARTAMDCAVNAMRTAMDALEQAGGA